MDINYSILTKSRFSMLEGKIDERILEGIKAMGIEKPTRIQAETLPHLMMHKDLIGTAKTGSGKTLAFLIPTIDGLIRLKFTRKHGEYFWSLQINVPTSVNTINQMHQCVRPSRNLIKPNPLLSLF